jgi:hypothetical protein
MDCDHQGCDCQSEVGIDRDGGRYCSESCAREETAADGACRCGHAGCGKAREAQPEAR